MAPRDLSLAALMLTLLVAFDCLPGCPAAFQVSPGILKQVKKVHMHCVNVTGAKEETLRQAQRDKVMLHDRPFQCFLHCMFDTFGLIDSQNVMHLESLNEFLPEEYHGKIIDLVGACGTKNGKDGCEVAYETVKCYVAANTAFIMDEILGTFA